MVCTNVVDRAIVPTLTLPLALPLPLALFLPKRYPPPRGATPSTRASSMDRV